MLCQGADYNLILFKRAFLMTEIGISNFIWNRLWTFPESRSRKKRKQLPQFALVNVVGLIINNLIVVGLDALLVPLLGEPLSYNVAKMFAIGVVLIWNFGVNRVWTYRGIE